MMPPKRKGTLAPGKGKKKAQAKPNVQTNPDVIQLSDSDGDSDVEVIKHLPPPSKKRKIDKRPTKVNKPDTVKEEGVPASGDASKNAASVQPEATAAVVEKKEEPVDAAPPVVQQTQGVSTAAVPTAQAGASSSKSNPVGEKAVRAQLPPTVAPPAKPAPSSKGAKKSLSASNVEAKTAAVSVPVPKPPRQEVQPQPVILQPKEEPKREPADPTPPTVAAPSARAPSVKGVKQSASHDSVLSKAAPEVTPAAKAKPKVTSLQDYYNNGVAAPAVTGKRKADQMEAVVSPPARRATRSVVKKAAEGGGGGGGGGGVKGKSGGKKDKKEEKVVQSRSKTAVVPSPAPAPKTTVEKEKTTVDKGTVEKKKKKDTVEKAKEPARAATSAEQTPSQSVQPTTTTHQPAKPTVATVPATVPKATASPALVEPTLPNLVIKEEEEETETTARVATAVDRSVQPTVSATVAKPTLSTTVVKEEGVASEAQANMPMQSTTNQSSRPTVPAQIANEAQPSAKVDTVAAANKSTKTTVPAIPVKTTVVEKEKASESTAGVARHLQKPPPAASNDILGRIIGDRPGLAAPPPAATAPAASVPAAVAAAPTVATPRGPAHPTAPVPTTSLSPTGAVIVDPRRVNIMGDRPALARPPTAAPVSVPAPATAAASSVATPRGPAYPTAPVLAPVPVIVDPRRVNPASTTRPQLATVQPGPPPAPSVPKVTTTAPGSRSPLERALGGNRAPVPVPAPAAPVPGGATALVTTGRELVVATRPSIPPRFPPKTAPAAKKQPQQRESGQEQALVPTTRSAEQRAAVAAAAGAAVAAAAGGGGVKKKSGRGRPMIIERVVHERDAVPVAPATRALPASSSDEVILQSVSASLACPRLFLLCVHKIKHDVPHLEAYFLRYDGLDSITLTIVPSHPSASGMLKFRPRTDLRTLLAAGPYHTINGARLIVSATEGGAAETEALNRMIREEEASRQKSQFAIECEQRQLEMKMANQAARIRAREENERMAKEREKEEHRRRAREEEDRRRHASSRVSQGHHRSSAHSHEDNRRRAVASGSRDRVATERRSGHNSTHTSGDRSRSRDTRREESSRRDGSDRDRRAADRTHRKTVPAPLSLVPSASASSSAAPSQLDTAFNFGSQSQEHRQMMMQHLWSQHTTTTTTTHHETSTRIASGTANNDDRALVPVQRAAAAVVPRPVPPPPINVLNALAMGYNNFNPPPVPGVPAYRGAGQQQQQQGYNYGAHNSQMALMPFTPQSPTYGSNGWSQYSQSNSLLNQTINPYWNYPPQ